MLKKQPLFEDHSSSDVQLYMTTVKPGKLSDCFQFYHLLFGQDNYNSQLGVFLNMLAIYKVSFAGPRIPPSVCSVLRLNTSVGFVVGRSRLGITSWHSWQWKEANGEIGQDK